MKNWGKLVQSTIVNSDDEELTIPHKRNERDEMFESTDDKSNYLQELQNNAEEDDVFLNKLECSIGFNQGIPNVGDLKHLQKKPG